MVLSWGVQCGFFLRKKPLEFVLPVYSNSETAIRIVRVRREIDCKVGREFLSEVPGAFAPSLRDFGRIVGFCDPTLNRLLRNAPDRTVFGVI